MPPATGQQHSPQPLTLPSPVLGSPEGPLQCHIPAHGLGAVPTLLWICATESRGMSLPKRQEGSGEQDQHHVHQVLHRGRHRVELRLRQGSQHHPPCPRVPLSHVPIPIGSPRWSPGSRRPQRASLSGCCSRQGSGHCTWSRPRLSSGGCQGWAVVGTLGRGGGSVQAPP